MEKWIMYGILAAFLLALRTISQLIIQKNTQRQNIYFIIMFFALYQFQHMYVTENSIIKKNLKLSKKMIYGNIF